MSFYHPKKFFKIMRNQELQNGELRVPKYFVKLHWKNVSNPVVFTLPNGSKQDVFWVELNGDIWFQKNWEKIAKSLIRGHVLVFKYKGGSCFKVEIFGCNTLELDYSNIKVEAEEVVVVSDDNVTNTNGAGTSQRRKGGKRKMNMDLDANQKKIKGSNRGGMIKKAKKCLRTEAVKERVRNYHPLENPSFEVEMSQSYAKGCYLRIPRDFSRKYLTKLEGTARFRVGEDMAIEVKLNFYDVTKSSTVTTGWNTFSKRYNLQLGDVCKFVITQREPLLFTIIITRAREEPNSKKLKMQGYREGISSSDNNAKSKDIKGTSSSRSCPKIHLLRDSKGHNVMKHNSFKICVNSQYPDVPMELMKRGCHDNLVELKMEGKSWFVKVNYYHSIHGCRFSAGWRQFIKECKVETGDTCLLKLIDEKKFVFNVSIVEKNPLAVLSLN